MFNLGSTDTNGQRTKSAMCCGMAVATYDGHTRMNEAVLRDNHMYDAVIPVLHIIELEIMFLAILDHDLHLLSCNRVLYGFVPIFCRYTMVKCGEIRC